METERKNGVKVIPFLLPVRCILFLSAFLLMSVISKLSYADLSKWWTSVAVICNLITNAILYIFARRKSLTFRQLLNYEKGKTKIGVAILIVVITVVVGMCGLYLAGLICYGEFPYLDKTMVQPIPLWLVIIVLLLLPLSTTLVEDGLYLGYAINLSKGNRWLSASLSAFFYALQHSFIPFLPDGVFILYRFLSFLPLTVIICFWYQKSRNPLPFMIGHFILNVATAVQILLLTVCPSLYDML
ncbi:MAG: CPBP family intramembrane metalloprotease [Clostridia bacterium]|nr:CPBP family intramembrane metalloprotease [Clostridia bacterium]